MAAQWPPKKNDAAGYTFYVSLVSQADTKIFQANPTLAAGDVKIAIDDGAPANLGTLPAVDADFTKRVKVVLSQAETNGDNLTIIFADAAGAEWCDLTINLQTVADRQSGDSFARLGAPTGASISADLVTIDDFLDTEVAAILAAVDTEVAAIKTKTDQLTFTGANRVDANVEAINNNTDAADIMDRSARGITRGTCDAGSTTTSIVTSSLTPAAVDADQWKGRIITFDKDTTTTGLRNQSTDITANTTGGVFTVTALTRAPASGDTFTIN